MKRNRRSIDLRLFRLNTNLQTYKITMSTSSSSPLWSESQRRAYLILWDHLELFFNTTYRDLTPDLRPRLKPLFIAPSGLGKSYVIRLLARDFGAAYMRLNPANWVVNGSKLKPTLSHVADFIDRHDRVIIHFDEVCKWKTGMTTDWGYFAQLEMFDLLDRCPSQHAREGDWTSTALQALEGVMMVGTATFQEFWTEALRPKVGFGRQTGAQAVVEHVRQQILVNSGLPDEIRLRFSPPIILQPPTANDFRAASERMGIARLNTRLGMPPLDFEAAASSGMGARWLEDQMAQLLLHAQQTQPNLIGRREVKPKVSQEESEDDFPNFGVDETEPVL